MADPTAGARIFLGYARSSTAKQPLSVDRQVKHIRSFAEERGYPLAEVFEDRAIPGWLGRRARPGFDALLRRAAENGPAVVIVESFDRLVRDDTPAAEFADALVAGSIQMVIAELSMRTLILGDNDVIVGRFSG